MKRHQRTELATVHVSTAIDIATDRPVVELAVNKRSPLDRS